ncbi:GNAT family N-acetyltransferase [Streptomyces sp. H10-C2]|uniref:GNAT family N-acetyltransferase n=1 Tax=unclassified Streptomyces TaxID=2593676 RepID=UPI0024B930EC|nr:MULTISPECIES: GNAT family N-acetyltransferase [unclassified Streptomyces]MDJ0341195.1 GNAT family N-acetyltransferase [Streptomyces sp. PH10-H1]MDJ0369452.1 GNAT family N-acetyltransferase [Streptomyces sp. H10-C2]
MSIHIDLLTEPTGTQLHDWHQVLAAALGHDLPGDPVPSHDDVSTRLTTPNAYSRKLLWLARNTSGAPVGTAALRLFDEPGRSHLASLELYSHPAHRRLGAGSRLLATAVDAARGDGRRSLITRTTVGTPGDRFLATRAFTPALKLTWRRLRLDTTDAAMIGGLAGEPHPGYRLEAWEGVAPDDLIDAFARAKQAMADMPTGGIDFGTVPWNAERVRSVFEGFAKRGEQLITITAVSDTDGSMAGYTMLAVPAGGTGRALQYDTAVVSGHRGHGLGRWLKASMIQRVVAELPGVTEIETDNADDNRHMVAINAGLGFVPVRQTVEYQLSLAE